MTDIDVGEVCEEVRERHPEFTVVLETDSHLLPVPQSQGIPLLGPGTATGMQILDHINR